MVSLIYFLLLFLLNQRENSPFIPQGSMCHLLSLSVIRLMGNALLRSRCEGVLPPCARSCNGMSLASIMVVSGVFMMIVAINISSLTSRFGDISRIRERLTKGDTVSSCRKTFKLPLLSLHEKQQICYTSRGEPIFRVTSKP
jgi:hypothetical protein